MGSFVASAIITASDQATPTIQKINNSLRSMQNEGSKLGQAFQRAGANSWGINKLTTELDKVKGSASTAQSALSGVGAAANTISAGGIGRLNSELNRVAESARVAQSAIDKVKARSAANPQFAAMGPRDDRAIREFRERSAERYLAAHGVPIPGQQPPRTRGSLSERFRNWWTPPTSDPHVFDSREAIREGYNWKRWAAGYGVLRGGRNVAEAAMEADDQSRRLQIREGSMDANDRSAARALARQIADKYGVPQHDVFGGLNAMAGANFSFEDMKSIDPKDPRQRSMIEKFVQFAKVADETVENSVDDLTRVALAADLPFKTIEERHATFDKLAGKIAVAPNMSVEDPRGMLRGIAQTIPLFRQLGGSVDDAIYLQSIFADMGFKGALGGHAGKSFLQRLINPTEGARQIFQQRGFDIARVLDIRADKLKSGDEVAGQLEKAGFAGDKKKVAARVDEFNRVLKQRQDAGESLDLTRATSALEQAILDDAGVKDKKSRGQVTRSLKAWQGNARGVFNLLALIEEMQKLEASDWTEVAGTHHAPKVGALKGKNALLLLKRFTEMMAALEGTQLQKGSDILTEDSAIKTQWERLKNASVSFMLGSDDDQSGEAAVSNTLKWFADTLDPHGAGYVARLRRWARENERYNDARQRGVDPDLFGDDMEREDWRWSDRQEREAAEAQRKHQRDFKNAPVGAPGTMDDGFGISHSLTTGNDPIVDVAPAIDEFTGTLQAAGESVRSGGEQAGSSIAAAGDAVVAALNALAARISAISGAAIGAVSRGPGPTGAQNAAPAQ